MARRGDPSHLPGGERDPVDRARRLARDALGAVPSGRMPVSRETRSMAPFLAGGDELCWERAERRPGIGAVVIFFRPVPSGPAERLVEALQDRGLTVHRVVGRLRDGRLLTKGDGLPRADVNPVPGEDLLGVVRSIVRNGREYRLVGGAAAVYAWLAAAMSRSGGLLFGVAARADVAIGRVVPPLAGLRIVRRPVWWVQRLAQEALYRMLFRLLHRGRPAGNEPPRQGEGDGR